MKKRVLITGTTSGIGRATAIKFLNCGYEVVGFDIRKSSIESYNYTHYVIDVSRPDTFPALEPFNIVINNAGTLDEHRVIDTNLMGYIYIAEQYCYQDCIESVVNVGSISAWSGIEPLRYVASQGGRMSITKTMAMQLGNKYKATVNSISFGAVVTELDKEWFEDPRLVQAIADENILKKWMDVEEAAEWIYFVAVVNKSLTGQDILIDNGESANYNFIDVDYFGGK